jgi:hypothetical protein
MAAAALQLTREETESSVTRGASVKLQHGDEHLRSGRRMVSGDGQCVEKMAAWRAHPGGGEMASGRVRGIDLGIDPWIDQPACYGLCRERFFLRSSGLCPNLSAPHERLPRTGTARRKHMQGVRGLACEAYVSCWSDFPLQGVHRFESPRLSDMSNCLFVAVIS